MTGFILLILATLLSSILFPIGIGYDIYKAAKGNKIFKETIPTLNDKARLMAWAIDVLGNYFCPGLLNDTLIKPSAAMRFGVKGITISSVTGYALFEGKLTGTGRWLSNTLNRFEKDHCIGSIGLTKDEIELWKRGELRLTVEELIVRNYLN